MPKISVIVPVYNTYVYLSRCLNSIVNQTYQNLEIILVDDGSTDLSGSICDEYAISDNRVIVIHKENEGVSVARNKALEIASGEFIGFVDSDDVVSNNMYEVLYKNLINTNSDISVCSYKTFKDDIVFKDNNNVKVLTKKETLIDITSDGIITNFLWNKLFKKEVFYNVEFPEGKIYEDVYVMPQLIDNINTLCFDDSILYGYFKRNDSYVNTYNELKNKNYLQHCDYCYNYLSKYNYLNLENYRCFYIYSSFLQLSKSRCLNAVKSKYMKEYLKIYKKNFKLLNKKVFYKRKLLFYLLYINEILFYKILGRKYEF